MSDIVLRSPRPSRLPVYWELARPITLLPPALGMLSGGITALGALPPSALSSTLALNLALGTLMAAVLYAGANTLNQIFTLDLDRDRKPARPLPSGRIRPAEVQALSYGLFAGALILAWSVNLRCFLLALGAAVLTTAVSIPPVRAKLRGILANLTLALAQGVLLEVAGWSCVKPVNTVEPWFLGLVFGLFLLGANAAQDLADRPGERAGENRLRPIVHGVQAAARRLAPCFVSPFLLLPLGALTGILTGNRGALVILGLALSAWGLWVVRLLLRNPEALAAGENHPCWTHLYLMMAAAQIGIAGSYLF